MTPLLDLAARVEAAEGNALIGEQTKALLAEAWKLLNPAPPHRVPRQKNGEPWSGDGLGPITAEYREWDRRRKFYFGCLELGAFESAAMTLVPEGWYTFMASQDRHSQRWKWHLRGGFGVNSEARAATPALALAAAALRARATQ